MADIRISCYPITGVECVLKLIFLEMMAEIHHLDRKAFFINYPATFEQHQLFDQLLKVFAPSP